MKFYKDILYCPQCGQAIDMSHGGYVCENYVTLPNGNRVKCGTNIIGLKKQVRKTNYQKNAVANVGLATATMPAVILGAIFLFILVIAPAIINGFLHSEGIQGCGAGIMVIIIGASFLGFTGLLFGGARQGIKMVISFIRRIFGDW
ncbi:MAG TPA: hypothetical protein PLH65_00880 [bacterium]|nr:hypothetical protein [bacterium]